MDVTTKLRTPLLEHAKYLLWNPRFSPDDRWVCFNATEPGRSRIFVAPVRDTGPVPEQEWITIADTGGDDKPRWSPDGNTLYFVSERDGFRCIWAQRLDSRKRPLGAAIAVFHAHQSQRSLFNVGPGDLSISVARDKIVFNMSERAGNLWLMNVAGRR
jgi:eukaryotic-like serine/threonine-protein kinase